MPARSPKQDLGGFGFIQGAVDDLLEDLVGLGTGEEKVADEEGGDALDAQADGLAVLCNHLLAVVPGTRGVAGELPNRGRSSWRGTRGRSCR